ncbi:ABC transporter ATP-binding protein [Candidiatus Paracoxiella cheracis]|uniref:ABC transporter ATP-binding protein n=1 Tax=Candidiatus Paracoxiella cheracis TaxID=3405120 RepID=UPI003BF5FA7C
MIELRNVTKVYKMGSNTFEALKGVSIHIKSEELVAIIGASGSGKTTTMNIVGLLDKPTTGEYYLNKQETSSLMPNQQAYLRNRSIGFIFQSFFLLPRLTALQNVGLPLSYRGEDSRIINEKSLMMLEKVGMGGYSHHRPSELSGGQQQRVAIARALVGSPHIILADEPTGSLDSKTGQDVLDLLIELNRTEGTTVVIITHDAKVAEQAQRVIKLSDGLIIE